MSAGGGGERAAEEDCGGCEGQGEIGGVKVERQGCRCSIGKPEQEEEG